MKNILIPMDFTEVAKNALSFGLQLFEDERIFILHTCHGSYYSDSMFDEPRLDKKKILQQELTNDVLRVLNKKVLPDNISIEVLNGDPAPVIQQYCKDKNIHNIVMGTRDKYSQLDKWIGTISLSVIKTINVPVYLIPPFAKYKSIKSTLVASDYHIGNKKLVQWIKEWNLPHQSFIRFLHIRNTKKPNFETEKKKIIDSFFEDDDPTFGFEIISKNNEDISQSLLASAYNYGSDLIIAIPENQTFIKSLLFKSVSKELIMKSEIPLLFINSETA